MCGPIAMALHKGGGSPLRLLSERLLYNLGRTATYTLLGLAAGGLGQALVWVVGYQVYLTALLGVGMLLMGLFSANPDRWLLRFPALGGLFTGVRKALGSWMRKAGLHTFFTIGLLNGFLPCGLVYVALGNAIAMGSFAEGARYMLAFGLGTLPLMFAAAVAGEYIQLRWRDAVRKLYPVVFALMGLLLCWRAYQIGTSPTTQRDPANIQTGVSCH